MGRATAQTSSDETARIHFQSADEYFRRGSYEDAEREFIAAFELSGRTALLFNIFLTRERLGNLSGAADSLRRYLAEDPNVTERANLEARLLNIDARIDAERRAEAEHAAEAERSAAAQHSDENDSRRLPLPATIAFGAGGAGVLVFAVAGGLALGEDRSLASSCGRDAGRTCSSDETTRLRRSSIVADSGLALGIAGAATGLVLALVLRDSDDVQDAAARIQVAPLISWDRIGLGAGGRF